MTVEIAMEALVRGATGQDVDELGELLVAANEPYRGTLPDAVLDAYLAVLRDVRGRSAVSETYVARLAGRLVGSVSFFPDVAAEGWNLPPGWAGFRALAVHPSARGRGIGRALADRCVERARELGAATIGIHTAEFMRVALPMYERMGFRRCPEFDFDAGPVLGARRGESVRALAYRLDLSS